MDASNKKRGIVDVHQKLHGLSDRAVQGYIKRKRIQVRPTDNSNIARVNACLCPLMSYMWYLINLVLGANLPAENKWNADATTYVFEAVGKDEKVCRLLQEDEFEHVGDDDDAIEVKRLSGGRNKSKSTTLPFAIKLMHMISAFGESSDLVLIIAIPTLPANEWYVEEVNGLSYSSHVGSKGFIYFCRTRCGIKQMWSDYFTRIVLPTIHASNEYHNKKDETGNLHRNFFSTDGEDIIISNAYDREMASQFRAQRVDYGRVGAATSGEG